MCLMELGNGDPQDVCGLLRSWLRLMGARVQKHLEVHSYSKTSAQLSSLDIDPTNQLIN